ncbi:MAG: hypothetical protein ACRCX8_18410 [Sarcina sp.]
MLINNKRSFEQYAMSNGCTENRIAVMEGVYKKLTKWEIVTKKSVKNASREELISMCQTGVSTIANRSYGAMKTRVDAVNYILNWLNNDIKLSMTDFNTTEILKDKKIRYYTKEEMQDICDLFINAQDKFIVYAMFSGILGKGYKDLLELKVTDVDLDNKIITTPSGKIIGMDDYLLEVTRETIDPVWGMTYYKYMTEETEGTTTGDYKLNECNEYVLKPKPYSKNNDGMDAMKINGIQRRLKKLSEYLNIGLTEEDSHFVLSGTDIYRSGLMHQMKEEEKSYNFPYSRWTCASLEIWLKENEVKVQAFELYRLYKIKYGI